MGGLLSEEAKEILDVEDVDDDELDVGARLERELDDAIVEGATDIDVLELLSVCDP